MKNIKKYLFALYLVSVLVIQLILPVDNYDEIWNFNMARNLLYGNLPYRDFNMIIFPLFPFLLSLLLRIFGNELLVYRLFQIILAGIALLVSWKVVYKYKKNNSVILYFVLFLYFTILVCNNIIEYNVLSLIWVEIIILLELSEKKYTNRFIIGLVLGALILTKQTVGILVAIFSFVSIIINNKNNRLKNIIVEISGILIPIIFLLFYIFRNSIQYEFFDYTFFSNSEFFKNGINYFSLLGISIKEILMLLIIFLIVVIFFIQKKKDENIIKLFLYSISMLSISVPIIDSFHLIISFGMFILLFTYIMKDWDYSIIDLYLEKYYKTIICIIYGIISILLIVGIYNIIINNKNKQLNHFRYLGMDQCEYSRIEEINKYISNNPNTYILDAFSIIHMISLDKFNNFFDMPLIGNLGSAGEDRIIDAIKNMKGSKILIQKDYGEINWQSPINAIMYVRGNYEKVDKIENFDVYEIK